MGEECAPATPLAAPLATPLATSATRARRPRRLQHNTAATVYPLKLCVQGRKGICAIAVPATRPVAAALPDLSGAIFDVRQADRERSVHRRGCFYDLLPFCSIQIQLLL